MCGNHLDYLGLITTNSFSINNRSCSQIDQSLGLTLDAAVCPKRCQVSVPRIPFCDHFKPSFWINNKGQSSCIHLFGAQALLGTQILGKVSWWKKHLTRSRVCPAKRLLWRCPSRRLLRVGYPLLPLLLHLPYLRDQDLAGERMSLVAHCPGLLRPLAAASMPSFTSTVAGCNDQSKPGDCFVPHKPLKGK